MKVSASAILGMLLIGGALSLHFFKPKKEAIVSKPKPVQIPEPGFSNIFSRQQLLSLPPQSDFSNFEQAYHQSE